MSIYVTYLQKLKVDKPEILFIDEIIENIRTGKNKVLVEQIRQESDKNKRDDLKTSLPAFFPSVTLNTISSLSESDGANGIIQFDIDKKDNPEIDFDLLRQKIIKIEEVLYLFESPSCGIKLGVLTDFKKHNSDTVDSVIARYKTAYKTTKESLFSDFDINFDDAVGTLKFSCFLSYDENAYLNKNCKIFKVDHLCEYYPTTKNTEITQHVSTEKIKELLQYIPCDLRYHERRNINFAVFNTIGDEGFCLLKTHWKNTDERKLDRQLKTQRRYKKNYVDIRYLINEAKKHGYKFTGSRAINSKHAEYCDYKFSALFDPQGTIKKIKEIVEYFFKNKKSTFLNAPAGLGKTHTVLECLNNIDPDKKVLFLVKTHKLAEEIVQKFNEIKKRNQKDKVFPSYLFEKTNKINHIKGKTYRPDKGHVLCENILNIEDYNKNGIHPPIEECSRCFSIDSCFYIQQFDMPFHNIRLMTHEEFINSSSFWFNGSRTNKNGQIDKHPRKWIPDYIIVDEDWLRTETDEESIVNSYQSISNIIYQCRQHGSLSKAILDNYKQLMDDINFINANQKPISFVGTKQYIQDSLDAKKYKKSLVLENIEKYLKTNDDKYLSNISLNQTGDKLIYCKIKSIQTKYKDIPVLYLDATADKNIVKEVIGDIKFIDIKVKISDKSNIYQLENANFTKSFLESFDKREVLIKDLKKKSAGYTSIGLITYQSIKGIDNFDKFLADQIGANIYNHFGNLRGLNSFKDVDCLFVVGRYRIPEIYLQELALAVYGVYDKPEYIYAKTPFRMKNGGAKSLENRTYIDDRFNNILNHFSSSETIQAIHRARLIWNDKPKDVYLYSKESLGGDIEVTDFFRIDFKYQEAVEELKKITFCENNPRYLKGIKLSDGDIKRHREDIKDIFLSEEIDLITVRVKNQHGDKYTKEVFLSDDGSLKNYLDQNSYTLID